MDSIVSKYITNFNKYFNKELNDQIMNVIRIYEKDKNLYLLNFMLDNLNIDTKFKDLIIKSCIENIGCEKD